MQLNESTLDPIQPKRIPEIFSGELGKEFIKSKVKNFILDNLYKWLDTQGFKYEDVIEDIYIEGSSMGFQYTPSSDIDVSVYSKIPDSKIDTLWKILPNGNCLPGTTYEVNYYLMRKGSKNLDTTDNCYDLLNDKWIKQQKLEDCKREIPFSYVAEIAKFFLSGVDDRIQEYETDKVEYDYIKSLTKAEIKDEEKEETLKKKETEIKADLDAIYVGHCMLKALRHTAYGKKEKNEAGWYPSLIISIKTEEEEKYNDPNRSISNLVYKYCEKCGYFKKLEEYEKEREKFLKK